MPKRIGAGYVELTDDEALLIRDLIARDLKAMGYTRRNIGKVLGLHRSHMDRRLRQLRAGVTGDDGRLVGLDGRRVLSKDFGRI